MTRRLHPLLRGLLLCLPVLAAGCAGTAAPPAPVLVGTEWRLESLGGREVPAGSQATLAFPEAGRVAGNASCNRFFGTYTQTRQNISFSQMGATRMACIGSAAEQETRYLAALQKAVGFEIEGSRLTIRLSGQEPPLRLSRVR
ncbi:MAG: hypothetical protein C0451_06605 [Comamonadaceae bacterium]|nr:hypothetical protein [Comamonadaceae bacterium]